ncbi:MAG: class I SAM-dependent RNA methyltransferase [Spirochaetaceae bacterium]|jgi:23S rRNA (uracil1939-C5)-methyltransferase|nr:class I SAM-dependent RNA methyltransferase [Spirochaetaceae bacterium]
MLNFQTLPEGVECADGKNALCQYWGHCGGCPLQNLAYEEQLVRKKDFLRRAFLRSGISGIPEIKVFPSRPFEYRSRVQFHRSPQGTEAEHPFKKSRTRSLTLSREKELLCGFMTRNGSSAIAKFIPVNDCLIAVPVIRDALKAGAIIPPVDRDRFCVYSGISGLLVEGRNSRGTVRVRQKDIIVDAGVFFQCNTALLESVIDEILLTAESAGLRFPAADFYCGVGTFAVFLQDIFERVDLLESNAAALRLARENLRSKNARFWGQTDTAWARGAGKRAHYSFAVADPGRQGLSEAMCHFLASGCELLCYVSCNPNALARDSVLLMEAGKLSLESLSFYDFYPQTNHVESLAVFRTSNSHFGNFSHEESPKITI